MPVNKLTYYDYTLKIYTIRNSKSEVIFLTMMIPNRNYCFNVDRLKGLNGLYNYSDIELVIKILNES